MQRAVRASKPGEKLEVGAPNWWSRKSFAMLKFGRRRPIEICMFGIRIDEVRDGHDIMKMYVMKMQTRKKEEGRKREVK